MAYESAPRHDRALAGADMSLSQEVTAEVTAASKRQIIACQPLYAFGVLLSVFSTYLGIGFIFAARLNAAITPLIWRLDRF